MRLMLPEIFEKVEKASTLPEKKDILLKNNSPVLIELLKLNYDPNIKLKLPEGEPPFKKTGVPMGLADSNLYKEMRRMYVWINPPPNLHKIKSESLFIQLLESINEKEAVLICAVKDKALTKLYPSMTYELVNEAFPGVLPQRSESETIAVQEIAAPKKRGRPKKVT